MVRFLSPHDGKGTLVRAAWRGIFQFILPGNGRWPGHDQYPIHEAGVTAIRMDGAGDVTKTHVAWKISEQVPVVSSPVVVVGHEVYFVNDSGIASCANISDGSILWTK